MLYTITLIVNFFAFALALWLGLYVVTRSRRSLIAWLTGLTLWSLAGLFLNVLLALNPPPALANPPVWLQLLFPFWQAANFEEQSSNIWLQGWSVTPGIVLWHHATTLMRPGPLSPWRWTRILLGYGAAIAAVIVQAFTPLFFTASTGDPIYLNTLQAGPLYPIFAILLLLYAGMSVANLLRSAQSAPAAMPRKQLIILAIATVIGGLAGVLSIGASAFGLQLPMVILTLLLGIAVGLIGYGVARYSALVDGRTMRRDFFYNAVSIGLVALLYLGVTWLSVRIYNIPSVAIVFAVMLAIISHALIDLARQGLDSIFYRRDTRRLRDNLRQLALRAGEQTDPNENLSLALDSLCSSVRATYGLLVLFDDEQLDLAASYYWQHRELPFTPADLAADDILPLEPNHFSSPFTEAALLIPLYAEAEQLGAIILGRPVNGIHYAQVDLELLLYPSDRMAEVIQSMRREADYLARIADLAEASQPTGTPQPTEISVKAVENALRNMTDFAHLGEHPLATMKLVMSQLPDGTVTHLDRGKAVYSILAEVVEKLRPDGSTPGDPPPREWYAYLILHSAYFEDIPNRDIMARLYISEGTFNRTRRSAIRAVTRTLAEMETLVK